MTFSNQQVAQIFRDVATAMEVLGEHAFKTQAYARAADTIANLPVSVYYHLEQGTLNQLPGVGPAISAKITELLTSGTISFRERLREQVPDGVLQIVRVPDASHWIVHEKPHLVSGSLRDFMRRQSSQRFDLNGSS